MLLIVSVMLGYMYVQLISWPWKLPALNGFDSVISIALILMMAILGAFAPDLSTDVQQRLTNAVIGIIFFLNVMVFAMLCVTASALIRLNVMGGSQESVILALGKTPQPHMLSQKFLMLSTKVQESGEKNFAKLLENLSVYDLRMMAQIITAVGTEVGEAGLIMSRRSQMLSTSSVSKVQMLEENAAKKEAELEQEKRPDEEAEAGSQPGWQPPNPLNQQTESTWL
ncbi:GABBR2 [Symbiodinium natans]|uniref:GABBR2 protein n=1 Tax=Symbiodinium natans TaxID=878477 RepID=A0A812SUM9_9DINO|nr:GABBR2 [Symbiodinium natans]